MLPIEGSLLADTDIFIDYLNGADRMRAILDSPHPW